MDPAAALFTNTCSACVTVNTQDSVIVVKQAGRRALGFRS